MKKALISLIEPGRVCDVVVAGEEFDTTPDFKWVDCADDVTSSHKYDIETNTFTPFDPSSVQGFAEQGYVVARQIAYKGIGEQLDMLFKELKTTGTISNDGPWAKHVESVKSAIPKDDPAAVMRWNRQYAEENGLLNPIALPPN